MVFTSIEFLLLLPCIVVLYNILPNRWRSSFLVLVSYAFYAWMEPMFIFLLIAMTFIVHALARITESEKNIKKRNILIVLGAALMLLPMVILHKSMPLGLPFYSLMATSYLIDVYYGEIKAEREIQNTALFISFFPIVMSGPIERAGNMMSQFKEGRTTEYEDLAAGVKMMIWGYMMKLCMADRIAVYLESVYNHPEWHNGGSVLLAALLEPLRLYGDLGGYSLIAIGAARCLGIQVMQNFNRPFTAMTMTEFWHRWHITLIQWIRDYVFNPMTFALRKWKNIGITVSLTAAFVLSGIWHRATLPFIVWGLIQAVVLSLEFLTKRKRTLIEEKRQLRDRWAYRYACRMSVYLIFTFSLLFTTYSSLGETWGALEKIVLDFGMPMLDWKTLGYAFIATAIVAMKEKFSKNKDGVPLAGKRWKRATDYILYAGLAAYTIGAGVLDGGQFIYIQF